MSSLPENEAAAYNEPEAEAENDCYLKWQNESFHRNMGRVKNGYRYNADLMSYSAYMRMIGGRLNYMTLKANSEHCIPSISAVNRFIAKTKTIALEGHLRVIELDQFLTDRDLPRIVTLSEDATRINGRIQYDPRTNKIVGFTMPLDKRNGMPNASFYKANSAADIESYFYDPETNTERKPSQNLNVIMAASLVKGVPPFCLMLFGTDSSFTAIDVYNRWQYIVKELSKRNIEVIAIASDSDPKFNSVMRKMIYLGLKHINDDSSTNFPIWFNADVTANLIPIQDTIHIGTKLRNRLLNANLKIGRHTISIEHLKKLLKLFPKAAPHLTDSVVCPTDRQNFDSVLKICDNRVISLLSTASDTQGTIMYLKIIQNILRSFLDVTLTPLEQIRFIWVATFLLRLWRESIIQNKTQKLKDNFITTNSYVCVEINAHSLILLILELKSKNLDRLFNIELFGSQPCENNFRQLRSLSSTFSTVTDCSLLEATHKMARIELQNRITYELKGFDFPRLGVHSKKYFSNTDRNGVLPKKNWNKLPNKTEIIHEVEMAKLEAKEIAKSLGITLKHPYDFSCKIQTTPFDTLNEFEPCGSNEPEINTNVQTNDNGVNKNIMRNFSDIDLKEYSNNKIKPEDITESSVYVKVENTNGEVFFVHKNKLCWLLSRTTSKLSSDRLIRVMSRRNKT